LRSQRLLHFCAASDEPRESIFAVSVSAQYGWSCGTRRSPDETATDCPFSNYLTDGTGAEDSASSQRWIGFSDLSAVAEEDAKPVVAGANISAGGSGCLLAKAFGAPTCPSWSKLARCAGGDRGRNSMQSRRIC